MRYRCLPDSRPSPVPACLRALLLPCLVLALGLGTFSSTAHALELETRTYNLNECYFDGQPHTRNFGSVNYGTVFIWVESIKNPPRRFGPRPKQISGLIMPGLTVGRRGTTPQPSSGFNTDGEGDVDPGHVMALHLGGPDNPLNIVPQWARWQRLEEWRQMERDLDAQARKIADESRPPAGGPPTRTILMNVAIEYRDTGTVTPSLTAWSFPARFVVSACPAKIANPNNCDGPMILDDKVFEGGPPH
jgi:hypothetical protein